MIHGLKITLLAMLAWVPIHAVRVLSLRLAGAEIARDAVLYHGYQVRAPSRLQIGKDSSIGERAVLDARGGLAIGESVNISSEVQIWSAQHDWRSEDFAYQEAGVSIGDHAWLGPRVIVLPGSQIGEGAVVGAGAIVAGRLEPWGLYVGVPAKRVKDRPEGLHYRLGGARRKLWFW